MPVRKWFVNFLLGKNGILLSESDRKSVLLLGQLALVALLVSTGYILIDHSNAIYGNEPYYLATSFVALSVVLLNRLGNHRVASIVFVTLLNIIVFLFSASDTYRSGIYIYFVCTGLTAFALFGYKDRQLALGFTILSLLLFIYSYLGDHAIMPRRAFTEEYLRINFTTNFIVAQVTSITIVYFLITVNYQSERQILAKNEQLAKANAELDRFVYSASHDLRAPLSSILGLVQVYNLSEGETERKEIVQFIQDRVHKMDDFIAEILDYSKNSRLDIQLDTVNGMTLFAEVIDGLRYSRGFDKNLIEVEPDHAFSLHTDSKRLKVILNNLLNNSLKYFDPEKGKPSIKLIYKTTENLWSITVLDNGLGIRQAHQEKIFDMFYRAHESSEGSGLGLYIVREVVERMGGSVSLVSELGKGSAFTVSFPQSKK